MLVPHARRNLSTERPDQPAASENHLLTPESAKQFASLFDVASTDADADLCYLVSMWHELPPSMQVGMVCMARGVEQAGWGRLASAKSA